MDADRSRRTVADSPLRVLVVGSGSIGTLTREVLAGLDGVDVVGVVGARDDVVAALAEMRPDVAAVCSANGLHVEHARAAVAAGCHAVVEKPLTLGVDAGRALLEEATRAGRTVTVISQRRWEPFVVAARDAVRSGVLGRPVLAECLLRWNRDADYFAASPWRGTTDLDGGVLFNQGVHVLDLMRWLVGPADTVSAHDATRARPIEAPDTATATLRFASGALGVVSATVASATPSPAELNLHFEHGTIRLADDRLVTWQVPGVPEPADEAGVGSGSADPAAIGHLGHRRQWEHIVGALRDGRPPEVTGEDALGTAALVAAIHASADADGLPVRPLEP